MFEFVCVIYFSADPADTLYVGNFESCARAHSYVAENFDSKEVNWVKCQHEDYLYLPKNFIKKEVRYD